MSSHQCYHIINRFCLFCPVFILHKLIQWTLSHACSSSMGLERIIAYVSIILHRTKGHLTLEPRPVTMKLWEPKRKCPKAIPTHLPNRVVWSRTLECSVKSYVTRPSTKCYFNDFLFMRVLTHDEIKWTFGVSWSPSFVLGLPPRGGFWK